MADKRWLPETLFDDLGFRMTFAVDKVLYEQQTEHQHLVLFEQKHFGKMLMLDGATQVTTRDEFIYHEMMTHVPILAHGEARERADHRRRRLRHRRGGAQAQGARRAWSQVEIDESVVEFSKEHFPEFTGPVFADKRFDQRDRRRHEVRRRDRSALRRDHRGLDRPAGAGRGAVHQGVLRRPASAAWRRAA